MPGLVAAMTLVLDLVPSLKQCALQVCGGFGDG